MHIGPATFLAPLRIEQIGPRRWLLLDDLPFHSACLSGVLTAPRGFQTDLASIPRFVWIGFPPMGRHNAAAVLHDAAYANTLLTPSKMRIFLIKQFADDLFDEALLSLGVGRLTRRFMVAAVRAHGDPLGHPLAANRRPVHHVRL